MGSVFGHLFRLSTFGESHGGGVGVVLEGCPPRLAIDVAEIQRDLDRRRPGQSVLTTPRQEADQAEILSGVFEGQTLGTPIGILVRNKDARPSAYDEMRKTYRPSHADYTTDAKYGTRNWQGGGRASARETIGRVAAGAIARKLLREHAGIEVLCWVSRVKDIDSKVNAETVTLEEIEANDVRCPDTEAAEKTRTGRVTWKQGAMPMSINSIHRWVASPQVTSPPSHQDGIGWRYCRRKRTKRSMRVWAEGTPRTDSR